MRKSSPQPIKDVVKDVVETLSRRKGKDIHKIISIWPRVAGKELARHTRPVHLCQKTLLVSAAESAWLYQANFHKEELLASLKKRLGENKVQNIQFRIGKR